MAAEDYLPPFFESELAEYAASRPKGSTFRIRREACGPPLVCRCCGLVVESLGDSRACEACEAEEAAALTARDREIAAEVSE